MRRIFFTLRKLLQLLFFVGFARWKLINIPNRLDSLFIFRMKSLTMWIYLSVFLLLLEDRSASGDGPDANGAITALGSAQQQAEWVDCVQASDMCNQNPHCSSRYRVMRQCLVGKEKDSMLDTNRECQAALEVLLVSPLYDCRCKRGMKKELQCLQSYWSIHMGLTEGGEFYETSPYEPVAPVRHPDAFRLASIISGMHAVAPKGFQCPDTDPTCNPCLDATKACNLNATCKKQRTAYITTCHKGDAPAAGGGGGGGGGGHNKGGAGASGVETCNRKRCHKALRQFLDRVPAEFTHRLLFCPCQSEGCSERRRQTIVPDCSFQDKVKPNCLELRRVCRQDPLCRSRLADFHMNCLVTQHTVSSCPNEDNYQACLASYTKLIGTDMTPNYVDSSYTNWTVSPWCTCKGSGNQEEECFNFLQDFTENTCLRNAIQAFGYSSGDNALQHKDESVSSEPSLVTAKPPALDNAGGGGGGGPPAPTTTSEHPNILSDRSQAGEGELQGKSIVEPSSGYDVLRRPEGQPGVQSADGSASLHRATAWALLPGLALTLLLAQQRAFLL